MKALKDCTWVISIRNDIKDTRYYWIASLLFQEAGICNELIGRDDAYSITAARNNFKEFAELNGITNYKFKE